MKDQKTGFAWLAMLALAITLSMGWANLRERWDADSRQMEIRAKLAEMEKKGESDPDIAFQLAKDYSVTSQNDKAQGWLRKASELGHLTATRDLAVIAAKNQDTQGFFKYLRKATELGDPEAAFTLACEFGNGAQAHRRDDEALKFLGRASELGFPGAKDLLEIAKGHGIEGIRGRLKLE